MRAMDGRKMRQKKPEQWTVDSNDTAETKTKHWRKKG